MGRYARHGRPLGRHAKPQDDRSGPDPNVTRDEGLDEMDLSRPDDPDGDAGVASGEGHLIHDRLQHYMMDMEAMDRRVLAYDHERPSRAKKAFASGFSWGLGLMCGACAGIIISAVLVFILLYLFGH